MTVHMGSISSSFVENRTTRHDKDSTSLFFLLSHATGEGHNVTDSVLHAPHIACHTTPCNVQRMTCDGCDARTSESKSKALDEPRTRV